MASAGTRSAAALLFSFSAVVLFLLLQAPPRGLADLVASALDRFLDGRGLLELATRRNMILLCHAILLIILRDAGVLGTPATASRSPTAAAAVAMKTAACSVAPAPPHATRSAVVVWRRRPRNRAAATMHDAAAAAARRLVECQPAAEAAAAATWSAPLLTTGLPPAQAAEEAAAVAAEQIVLAESPRNDDDDDDLLDHHDRDAVVQPVDEHPTAIAVDGETDCDDRRIVAVADDDDDEERMDDTTAREQQTARMEMEMELADDRTFEEFIKSQRRKMRQESLQLVSSGYHYQAATATCY